MWPDEFNRWASPLADAIGLAVVENLAAKLRTPRVALLAQTALDAPDYRVVVDVQRFETAPGSHALVDAVYSRAADEGRRRGKRPRDPARNGRRPELRRARRRAQPGAWPASRPTSRSRSTASRRGPARRGPFSGAMITGILASARAGVAGPPGRSGIRVARALPSAPVTTP